MIEKDRKIHKGLPPAREATCYQVQTNIVIPAGTILRSTGPDPRYRAQVGEHGEFTLFVEPGSEPAGFRRVIAA